MKSFKQRLITAASAATLAFGLQACAAYADEPVATASAAPAAAEMIGNGPALWKVADDDTTIYLFGTVHALPEDIDWYNSTIANALTSSDTLITEIPSGKETEAKMQQLVMSTGMLTDGRTLRTLLDDEEKATYEGALTKLGLPESAFDRFEPWMAGLTLTMLPLMQQGYTADAGVEARLEKLAGPEIARGALETPEFQIGLFDSMEEEAQVEFLVSTAEAVDMLKPMLDAMVAEWLEGDADALAAIMNEELDDPAVAEMLLYGRNANWVEWIDDRLEQPGTVFIAVGAGHLAGEKSVQDLLRQRGITSHRVQ